MSTTTLDLHGRFDAVRPERLQRLLDGLLPPLLTWTMTLLAAWMAGSMLWQLLYPSPPPAPLSAGQVASAPAAGSDRVDAEAVASLNLFGEAESAALPMTATPVPDDLPETRLRVTLLGVFAAEPASEALAMVRVGDEDKVVRVSAAITDDATLEAVYLDRIVLRRAGRLETLRFPASDAAAPRVTRPAGSRDVASAGSALQGSLAELTRILRPTPVREGGQQVGYRVVPGQDRQAFRDLGLRAGDLILSINNQALSDHQQSLAALQQLAAEGRGLITVRRGDRELTLSVPIDD